MVGEWVSCVLTHLFSFIRDWQLHQFKSEQVVHVHALGPAFLVPDLRLVLQVTHNLRLAGQGPEMTKDHL